MVKVSIITVNYNNKSGLERTIRSVVEQTFTDYEYIVIDASSTDGSKDVVHKYSDKISKWVSEPDTGIYNAMNKGLRLVTGEYCLFLNSGDYLYSENTLAEVFNRNLDEDIVYGDMIIEHVSGKKEAGMMPDNITLEHMIKDTLWHPVSFIKKEIFDKFGYYREDLKIVGDYDFFIKNIIINKVSTCHIPIPVAVFLLDGISSQPGNVEIIKSEKEKVQLEYFSKEMIESIQEKISTERAKETSKNNSIMRKISRWFQS